MDGSVPPGPVDPVYFVDPSQLPRYRERPVVVRAHDPVALRRAVDAVDPVDLRLVQWLNPAGSADALLRWRVGLPVELRIGDPAGDPGLLYELAALREDHPVRVALPVRAGFAAMARIALALRFAVRLEPGQPAPERVSELAALLDYYLRNPTVSTPLEFFHSLLGALLERRPLDLWQIQEEDPAQVRWVDGSGRLHPPGRLRHEPAAITRTALREALAARYAGCPRCPHQARCAGYFQWPEPGHDCGGIRELLTQLEAAAAELAADLAGCATGRAS